MRLVSAAVIVTVAGLALTAGVSASSKAPATSGTAPKSSMRAPKSTPKPAEQPKAEAKPAAESHDEHASETTHDDHTDAAAPAETNEAPAPVATPAPTAAAGDAVDGVAALTMLKEGNERWVSDTEQNPSTEPQRRQDVAANGQHPFVTVLTCADSRLPVERIFDRGVGEIFTVRVAGNISGDSEIATIEYGTEHLKTPLLVVMGHTKCGAVAAAVTDAEVHGKVAELVGRIEPAVDRAKRLIGDANPEALAAAAVKENVWQSVTDLLKTSSVCRDLVKNGELQIVGAVCDISTGKVEFMGEHPWQSELVAAFDAMSSTATAEVETH
jgi:carbonic anhydrase